jgi:hypothetical protein
MWLALGAWLCGCVAGARPVERPRVEEAVVRLESTVMPQPIRPIARHAFFEIKRQGSPQWSSVEFGSVPREAVRFHAEWRGPKAEAAIDCLEARAPALEAQIAARYLPWPGPNSNTFVDRLLRACGLHADLPATAIGKDWRGPIGASFTSGGTGLQLETPLVGVRLGLTEGIEVHLFALAFGIDWWPPAIILPIDPGRLGFDDR